MRILVAGASGLIGSAVADRLSREGTVASLGRRSACDLRADLAEPSEIAALELSGFDAVVHCAGVVDEDFANPAKALRQATQGAAALVAAACAAGVRRFAYISSAHVYGPMLGDVDERSPADPRSEYAIAHYATEQILRRSADRFDAAAAFRPCAVFGAPPSFESFRRWSLIPFSFPRAAAREGEIVLKSTGEQRRNLVAASDIGETVARWLHRPVAAAFEVFNPVGIHSLSVWEFAQLCAAQSRELLGRETKLTRVPPGPTPNPGASFDYGTIHEFCRGSADLRAYVAQAITALRQPAESNAL